ncbi:MAG: bifunctional hydroxymethylpyrimidine kinase/phosphomethylpyrimidine kinase [Canidatus Methanoxibalbensis ujae]|nr:bifunctional hydroxymethylpyrimidine kinase/phosphomethylpyrimidine kinase [Candidatus Methanoxibalbensis ujae]
MRTGAVLTVGGSDSSCGAGIQADLKTFAALGVECACVITAVTAQSVRGVRGISEIPATFVRSQLEAVMEDHEIEYAKTGMLYSANIVNIVSDVFEENNVKFVLDPVIRAGTGDTLLNQDALDTMIKRLLPISSVVTPNVHEAEAISGVKIETIEEAREAAVKIAELGARTIIIKGGHLRPQTDSEIAADIIYDAEKDEFETIKSRFIRKEHVHRTHGAGCTFSAALTAALARGYALKEAAMLAKNFVSDAIKFGDVFENVVIVNQTASILRRAYRHAVIETMKDAVEQLRQMEAFRMLIPEVGSNLGMASEDAHNEYDVAAIDGRITHTKNGFRIGSIEFGASSHVARAILTMMQFNRAIKSAINVKYSPEIVEICERLFVVASFEREKEPEGAKTMEWGVRSAVLKALKEHGTVPDVIFDRGAVGKEPIIRIFGRDAVEVVEKVGRILESVKCNESFFSFEKAH